LISLFAVGGLAACLAACTAGTNAPGPGTGGSSAGGTSAAGTAGATGSGGGAAGTGGSATTGIGGFNFDASTDGPPTCGLQTFDLKRKPAEILLVLDRSKSMIEDTVADGTTKKWDAALPALKQVIMDTDTSVSWGLKVFPEGEDSACVAASVTNNVVVPMAPMNAANVVAAINATTPAGNGTPTGSAINAAVTYLRTLTTDNPKYILLATDGQPSCGALPSSSTGSDIGGPYAETAVSAALTAGFPTFVLGVATSSSGEVAILNSLADKGGKPRPNAPLTHFYLGTSQAELTAAFRIITGEASNCVFPLNPPPPVKNDPSKLGAYIAGNPDTKIPHDPTKTNGWAYTDDANSAVQVFGSWCEMIKGAGADKVKIIYGCPLIDVP
jgi:hypothetical protein